MAKGLSLRGKCNRKVGNRWWRGRAEERIEKREESSVCFSLSTLGYFLCSTLSLFISHPSVRGVGGGPCLERPHTHLAFRKLALAALVVIMNRESNTYCSCVQCVLWDVVWIHIHQWQRQRSLRRPVQRRLRVHVWTHSKHIDDDHWDRITTYDHVVLGVCTQMS